MRATARWRQKKLVAALLGDSDGKSAKEQARKRAGARPRKRGRARRAGRSRSDTASCWFSEDSLRVEQAARARSTPAASLSAPAAGSPRRAKALLGKLDALIIDVGRAADQGLAFAAEVDASDHPIHLFIVGVRDARAASAPPTQPLAELFRAPAGRSRGRRRPRQAPAPDPARPA